jgi:hypothetical protein
MRISSAGNVDIGGATNAGNTLRFLDIYNTNTGANAGCIMRLISSDDAGTSIAVGQISKYKNGTMVIQNGEPGSNGSMLFYVGAFERVRITSTGSVGVGTTAPAVESTNAKLAVVGAINQSASTLATANTNAGFTVRANAASGYQLAIGATSVDGSPYLQGLVYNGGSSASYLILQGYGGSVGIGTTTPSSLLDVGTVAASDNFITVTSSGLSRVRLGYQASTSPANNVDQAQIFADGTGNINFASRTNNASGLLFYTNSGTAAAERMRITSAGNVGIGTSSPATSATLEIAGTTGALLVPRLTTTERNALTAANGMILYNTTDNQMQARVNGAWVAL